MSELAKGITVHFGDCLAVLPTLPENAIDSCVTDPPYHLTSIVKRMSSPTAAPVGYGSDGRYQRVSGGFMGKQWDGGDIAFRPELWAQVYRVLKPGAHILAFGGTRTYHNMARAIEDAGFEIRDCIQWLYGSGFPKSHDVSKGIDRAAGAEREIVGVAGKSGSARSCMAGDFAGGEYMASAPATDAARQWQGWGTALKPACEPIVLARKPLSEKTVAANVLKWGTGAINVDGCRVAHDEECKPMAAQAQVNSIINQSGRYEATTELKANGRWPANVIHDGSQEVLGLFPDAKGMSGGGVHRAGAHGGMFGKIDCSHTARGDEGSAARFFYTAKADSDDRIGSRHPTVKPVDLIQYLVRLVTPKGGTVLDPFAGTGTTGEAACYEGCQAILIEREAEYLTDMQRRMRLVMCGPDERAWQSAKARADGKPVDAGPLFGGTE